MVWRRSASAVETIIDGEISLYEPRTETVMVLNGTASDIWRLCDGRTTVGELTTLLAGAYGVDREMAGGEVARAIADIARDGFLVQI